MKQDFSRRLIQGKIAEDIFEQMFKDVGQWTVLRYGYESTVPELAHYISLLKDKEVVSTVRKAPDFVIISNDKTVARLVEVKYRIHREPEEIKKVAEAAVANWDAPWLFVASPDGFFFEPCHTIIKNNGEIGKLFQTTIPLVMQEKYLKKLKELENKKT